MIADKRVAHNALERQRRENLNTKFQELAHTLPGLQTVRRPSKSMIVTKSLEFGKSSRTFKQGNLFLNECSVINIVDCHFGKRSLASKVSRDAVSTCNQSTSQTA
jgi:hypothetical protein